MSSGDKDPLQDFDSLPIAEQYDTLIEAVLEAQEEGVLTPLPDAPDQVVTDAFIATRLRTVRTRLYLLGYLRSDNQRPDEDRNLRRAIRNFQAEAGLTVDGWVGPETWTALQELVSFEEPANMGRWVDRPEVSRALRRAVGLRLSVFGFLESPTRNKRKINRGLRAFVGVAGLLRLPQAPLEPTYSLETLTALFGQDGWVKHLAALDEGVADDLPPEDAASSRRFVAHVAKIELWLLGYGVQLAQMDVDERGQFPMPPPESRDYYRDPTYSFYYALYSFWRDAGQYAAKARKSARQGPTGVLFGQLLALADGQAPLAPDPRESEQLYSEIVKASAEKPSLPREIWGFIQEIGSRMWDGIRRAWLWFRDILEKAEPMLNWARNLARLAYRYALYVFEKIKGLVDKVIESAQFFVCPTVPGSDPPRFAIYRDDTFDYYLHASDRSQAYQLRALSREMLKQSRYFSLGIRILGVLAKAVIEIITTALLPGVGWFVFILALVRVYRDVLRLVREGTAYQAA